jgi:hypothetical protein
VLRASRRVRLKLVSKGRGEVETDALALRSCAPTRCHGYLDGRPRWTTEDDGEESEVQSESTGWVAEHKSEQERTVGGGKRHPDEGRIAGWGST